MFQQQSRGKPTGWADETNSALPVGQRPASLSKSISRVVGRLIVEWNDPGDVALLTSTFDNWTNAVISKDRVTIAGMHDEGFRVRLGDRLLNKHEHTDLEIAVANTDMKLIEVEATRRIGDLLLAWTRHFIKVSALPPIPNLGLFGDWGNEAAARRGFIQGEFSVWRFEGKKIKCVAFDIGSYHPNGTSSG
jgi:hypothetical protein